MRVPVHVCVRERARKSTKKKVQMLIREVIRAPIDVHRFLLNVFLCTNTFTFSFLEGGLDQISLL